MEIKINGEDLVNDWLEGNGRFKKDPQISNPDGTRETNGALDPPHPKKSLCFLWRKMKLEKLMLVLLVSSLQNSQQQ